MDILIIGTNNNLNAPKAQLETWASHPVRRHFFLATENDDPDPSCHLKDFKSTYVATNNQCKNKSPLKRPLYPHFKSHFAREQWMKKKANPVGWFCAQRRFSAGLAKVMELYKDDSVSLPDYLIITDDDTYMNMEHLNEHLLNQPYQLELRGQSQEQSVVPMSDVPVAWTGCRVHAPVHELNFTFGFGGYGYLFSKGTIERLMEPLHCGLENDGSKGGFHKSACDRMTDPEGTLIREDEFYKPGMSLMDVWGAFTRGVKHFCLHGDWIFGYFLNFYDVSRHVVNGTSSWFDDVIGKCICSFDCYLFILFGVLFIHHALITKNHFCLHQNPKQTHICVDVENPNAHLHTLMNSEIYRKPSGFCLNEGRCGVNETICHKMNETSMKAIHDAYTTNY